MINFIPKVISIPICGHQCTDAWPNLSCFYHRQQLVIKVAWGETVLKASWSLKKTGESLVSMRKQPDHWWTPFRSSRSERRQPSPESQRRLFGPVNETCQRILGTAQ
ncbi:hypothetical protein OUZ56_008367 [Daphnia magna]|uniref:Uncharacterized protein n=1 Tax=Daphnia magna TaxID=35525 RepID=A0ABR0ACR7_9CRUS|nr:hypothetical protein OUZ56_008367 [Daphnia magna]